MPTSDAPAGLAAPVRRAVWKPGRFDGARVEPTPLSAAKRIVCLANFRKISGRCVDGRYRLGECCLTISLGEPYQGAVYKLIAAIIEPDRRW